MPNAHAHSLLLQVNGIGVNIADGSHDNSNAALEGDVRVDKDGSGRQPMETSGDSGSDEEAASGSTIQSLQGVLDLMVSNSKPMDEVSGPLHGLHISDLPATEEPIQITENDPIVQVGRVESEVDGVFIIKVSICRHMACSLMHCV